MSRLIPRAARRSAPRCRIVSLGVAVAAVMVASCDVPTDLPRFESTFIVPTEQLAMPISGRAVQVAFTRDLTDTRDLVRRARGGSLVVDVENQSAASGAIELRLSSELITVVGSIDARGGNRQRISLSRAEVQALLGQLISLRASGTLCPATSCAVVAPTNVVTLHTRIELTLELGTDG
jgi:hypothetical protein